MKKLLVLLLLSNAASGQSSEVQQLLLNVQKLREFKAILQEMKDGYQVLYKGYTNIKNISEGNFSLHQTFLDGLFEVSPVVRSYKRIGDIIRYQLQIVKEYRAAYQQFQSTGQFSVSEIEYLGKVYQNLFIQSLKLLDELATILTSGKLRMSDDERLQAIDRIYEHVVDQYCFLNEFNNESAILSLQREKEKMDVELMRKIHGLR